MIHLDRRALLVAAPFGVVAAGGGALWWMIERAQDNDPAPAAAPPVQTDRRRVPAFRRPGLGGQPGFGSLEMVNLPKPMVVNFFASWCPPCVEEHPLLLDLQKQGVPVWGIAYKDQELKSLAFLQRYGNPYERVARDDPGRVAIDWALGSVPETYVVDRRGFIRLQVGGTLTVDNVSQRMLPLLREIARE